MVLKSGLTDSSQIGWKILENSYQYSSNWSNLRSKGVSVGTTWRISPPQFQGEFLKPEFWLHSTGRIYVLYLHLTWISLKTSRNFWSWFGRQIGILSYFKGYQIFMFLLMKLLSRSFCWNHDWIPWRGGWTRKCEWDGEIWWNLASTEGGFFSGVVEEGRWRCFCESLGGAMSGHQGWCISY